MVLLSFHSSFRAAVCCGPEKSQSLRQRTGSSLIQSFHIILEFLLGKIGILILPQKEYWANLGRCGASERMCMTFVTPW